ncbi:MAG: hypothetical protein LUB61_00700, partial [Eggerthellaceae bacterium]|nr:hypothetical protein [Eggerthellaceae bacterium]
PLMPASFCRDFQYSPDGMVKAIEMISEADLVIVIGTTGFRSDEYLSRMRPGTRVVQINPSRTAFDSIADLNIRADAAEVLDAVMDA